VMLIITLKYPSITPECEGGYIQEREGGCIIRMWYKGYKVKCKGNTVIAKRTSKSHRHIGGRVV